METREQFMVRVKVMIYQTEVNLGLEMVPYICCMVLPISL